MAYLSSKHEYRDFAVCDVEVVDEDWAWEHRGNDHVCFIDKNTLLAPRRYADHRILRLYSHSAPESGPTHYMVSVSAGVSVGSSE